MGYLLCRIMALPYFFTPHLNGDAVVLDEDTSRHIVQVLRMQREEEILLTDGKGTKAQAVITDDNRKRCEVKIRAVVREETPFPNVIVAMSLLKNASRFEWFLEKATEIGVREIVPLLCQRTEKEKFRHDRLQQVTISAMLQSQQCWLPFLHEPTSFQKVISETQRNHKFIAHCAEGKKAFLSSVRRPELAEGSTVILIGPEGDFTPKEIEQALQNGFQPVTLGKTRLRSETAGIVAAVLLVNGL